MRAAWMARPQATGCFAVLCIERASFPKPKKRLPPPTLIELQAWSGPRPRALAAHALCTQSGEKA